MKKTQPNTKIQDYDHFDDFSWSDHMLLEFSVQFG